MPASNDRPLLTVSVGNTRTRIGRFQGSDLEASTTLVNTDRPALEAAVREAVQSAHDAPAVLATVNPAVSDPLHRVLTDATGGVVHRVERDLPIPIGRQLDREAITGEDRLLNAAAAFHVLQQACVVVDAGTAITVDFIDGAGTLHGGGIAPGGQMMLNALHGRTAMLPELEFGRPEEPIGHNTAEAMKSGCFYGLRGMVHELVEQIAESVGAFPLVVATGGDGALLFKNDDRVDRVVPELTLMGIELTWRTAVAAAEQSGNGEADTGGEA